MLTNHIIPSPNISGLTDLRFQLFCRIPGFTKTEPARLSISSYFKGLWKNKEKVIFHEYLERDSKVVAQITIFEEQKDTFYCADLSLFQ